MKLKYCVVALEETLVKGGDKYSIPEDKRLQYKKWWWPHSKMGKFKVNSDG